MGEIAEKLREWADKQSYTHSSTFIRFAPNFGQKEIIIWLLSEKPMLGQKVQKDFNVLQEKVCDLNSWSAKPIDEAGYHEEFCPRIDEIRGIAYDLVETLRFIGKPAETEQNAAPAKSWKTRAWNWFKKHPQSYGLMSSFIFLILFFVLGLFKEQWRNWCWGTAAFAFLGLILSLLGGRSR